MKKIVLLTALSVPWFCNAQSQHYRYSYDASGNRISRTLFVSAIKKSQLMSAEIKTYKDCLAGKRFEIIYKNGDSMVKIISCNGLIEASCFLYDATGAVVYKSEMNAKETTLNMSEFKSGIYLLKIVTDKESSIWKLINY